MEVILGNCNHGGNIVGLVFRQVGYIFKYKSNIASLDTEVGRLRVDKEGMQQKINQATRNNEEILVPVVDWMERSDKVSADAVRNPGNVEGHAKAKCSFRSFPNLFWRHRLSKDAKKMADSIASLRRNIPNDPISCSRVPPSSDDVIDGYEAFESRNSIMNQIMEALKDPEVRVVGLHGMGGSGKTMLAKEVSRLARLHKVFEIDVMVTVSQIQDLHYIQDHIAEMLGLDLSGLQTMPARANKLRNRLRQEQKKILITLDDVWDKLDLQEIGVSFENNQMGCKIFLTSRSAHVCDIMKAEKSTTFKLSDLTDKEARLLFDKNVGVGDSARGPDFKNLAAEITKECAGLPLAIVIVASALKNRELNAWQDALLQLQKSTPTNIDGMIKQVYSSIMISFKYLESEEARYLLLLCSLHVEDDDILIEDLIKYSVGLRLFSDIIRLKEVRNRVQNLVGKLKLCNLLLDGIMSVKMHDVVRDACLYIASRDECMHFIRDVVHLKEVESKKLEESTAISLPYEAFNQLPQKLKYPKLKLLLLRGNESQPKVEILNEECFEEMKDLRVLCLINIRANPTCFSSLKNLQTLCLRHCQLQDIAPIGELNNLKILDLSGYSTFSLPREIGRLAQLQFLDVNPHIVVPHVLSNLKNVEHLHMRGFRYWGEGNASPVELKNLTQLTTLHIHVPNFEILPRANNMISLYNNLERYHIIIGDWDHTETFFPHIYSKILQLQLVKSHHVKDLGLDQSLIKTIEGLCLKGFVDVIDLFELDLDHGFPHVKSLLLEHMLNLEKICSGKLTSGSFGKLKEVKVKDCNSLKSLFSFSIARQFEEIRVFNCRVLQEIGTHEYEYESHNAINDTMKESQLVSLELHNLPKLNRFFLPPEAETISISEKGEELFNTKVLFPKLRNLRLFGIEVVKLWPDNIQDASFMEKLTELMVRSCSNLNYLFSFDVAKSLKLLERLAVRDLKALEVVIVVKEEMEVKGMEKMLFPKLHTLELCYLPNMATFCSQCSFEFPSLKTIKIKECPKVSDLALIGELNNLKVLNISGSSFVELPRGIERSTQLKILDLSSLKVIQPDVISKLIHLEELIIMPKSYIAWEAEGISSGGRNNTSLIEFKNLPKLTVLKLLVTDFNILSKDMFSEKWKVCYIKTKDSYIYFNAKDSYSYHNSSKLELSLNKREIEIVKKCGLQVLLKISQELRVDGCEDVNDIIYELDKEGFLQLRKLTFQNNSDARYILNSFSTSTPVFVRLKELSLYNLTTLEKICHGEPQTGSFRELTSVNVIDCVRLKSLFSISIAIQLQFLTVKDCEAMEAIVTIEGEDDSEDSNDLAFTELWDLKLQNLPRHVQFCSKLKTTSTSHWREEQPEEELEISMPLFDAKVQMPQLRWLELERISCKQIWHHQHSPTFDNLTNLRVSHCHNLKSLMSYSIAANLGFLSYLRVSDCENMEEVISTKEEEEKLQIFAFKTIAFNELRTLILKNLSSLRRFSSTSTIKASQKKTLLDGEVIVTRCDRLESLTTPSVSFHNLIMLEVSKCNGLIKLFDSSVVRGLLHLKEIIISECEGMTEIIGNDHDSVADTEIVLKELRSLYLDNLPNLRCFYYGNSTISFPNLKKLVVRQCFEMQVFSHRIVNSPMLNSLITEVERWEGNINSTIEKISEERNKMFSSNLNEEVTNQKDSMEYNNEDELSSKFTELSGEEVMKDSRKGKLEQATKSSSSGQ